ncbi:MAG: dihydrofolate reductase family protein [bacterium]
MKTILFMAISADGYIATSDHKTPWSDEDWNNFKNIVRKTRNIIIGRKTYEIMNKHNGFSDLNNPKVLVVSSNPDLKKSNSQHIICQSPIQALQYLKKNKFDIALLSGGGKLNASFIKENLIAEMYLDVEPFVFGKGIKLFEDNKLKIKLKLLGTKKYSLNGIQLHYQVLK